MQGLSLPTSTVKDGVRPCSFSAGVLRPPETEVDDTGKGGSPHPRLGGFRRESGVSRWTLGDCSPVGEAVLHPHLLFELYLKK